MLDELNLLVLYRYRTCHVRLSTSITPPLYHSPTESPPVPHLLPLLQLGVIPDTFRCWDSGQVSASFPLVGQGKSTLLRVGRGQSGVGLSGVERSTSGTGSLDVGGAIVDTISLSHSLDLVVGKLGQLLGDNSRSSLGDVGVGEDDIELLERSTGGFGVEEVDEGQEDQVGNTEDEESVRVDRGSHGWQDLHDQEVGQPVGHCRDSVGLSSDSHRVELGGVQPWEGQPSGTEEGDEEEETDSSALCVLRLLGCVTWSNQTAEGDEHRSRLSKGSDEE